MALMAETISIQVGGRLGPVVKTLDQEQISDFEACSATMMEREAYRNIHNDPALAAGVGLSRPIASGMMSISFLNRVLFQAFGTRWTHGGELDVRFLRPMGAGDTITANAVVTALDTSGPGATAELEVWCENQQGDRTAAGRARLRIG